MIKYQQKNFQVSSERTLQGFTGIYQNLVLLHCTDAGDSFRNIVPIAMFRITFIPDEI